MPSPRLRRRHRPRRRRTMLRRAFSRAPRPPVGGPSRAWTIEPLPAGLPDFQGGVKSGGRDHVEFDLEAVSGWVRGGQERRFGYRRWGVHDLGGAVGVWEVDG